MRIKAFILAIVFLLAGSGLSVDIAQCCDSFSGVSLSLNSHNHQGEKDCCLCFKSSKTRQCCEDVVIQTVINPVLGLSKILKLTEKFSFDNPVIQIENLTFASLPSSTFTKVIEEIPLRPVPILIQKRVLQV